MIAEAHDEDRPQRFSLQVWLRILALARPFAWHGAGLAAAAVAIAACEVALPYLTGLIIDDVTSGAARFPRLGA